MAVVLRYVLVTSLFVAVCNLEEIIDLCKVEHKCIPRNTSVPISKGNTKIYPTDVIIERCFGSFRNFACKPRRKANVTVRVSDDGVCRNFTVEKHISCKMQIKCGNVPCTTGTVPDKNCKCVKQKKKRLDRKRRL